jgi:hypothetical protein
MKRGEQDSSQADSAVSVMRTLVHMLQIMQRREVTKYLAKQAELSEDAAHLQGALGGT